MKNCIVFISSNVELYGADRSMLALMNNLKKYNYDVLLIINKHGRIEEALNENDINYLIIPFKIMVNTVGKERKIKGIVKNIINKHLSNKAKKIIKKMDINPVIVHTNVSLVDFGYYLAKKLKIKHIQHIREMGKDDFGYTFDLGFKHFYKICRNSDKVICISKYLYDYYSRLLPKDNMILVYNGINCDKNNKGVSNTNCLIVGRLEETKGQLLALQAINELKNYPIHLDIYGDGVYKDKLEKYIEDNNLQNNATMKGYSTSIDYSKYSFGLMCSKCEAFGRTTVEYMANNILVIGSNSGATSELLEYGNCGLLFNQGDYHDLASKIKYAIENNQIIDEYKKKAYDNYKNNYTEDIYFKNILKVYKDLL